MRLNDYKKCDKCGQAYNVAPFACMRADGERTDSAIEIYGFNYDLCPSCTYKVWKFLQDENMK